MSCFGMAATASTRRRGGAQPWRWWRRCAGLAAAIHSMIKITRHRRAVRWPVVPGRRRSSSSSSSSSLRRGWCQHRSFAPVYIDELYSQPTTHHVDVRVAQQQPPSAKLPPRSNNVAVTTNAGKARVDGAATKRDGLRSVVVSPMRGGGGGMGEVDMRAEVFIRKFREEMRLQSADEFHAMLARDL